ncbi:endonuclease/exonuclease/phosphatase family protein [Tessaracoccus sp. OH4464_COT-324]|uniref:endonuclease/exonuclease/phosphatase family protein n=1 Tax=Tessaracoccus sp. OH4464_COT-324 TaxID=2491059 RepID=UPI000F63E0CA|nr:endonuclease/exonuclease/phosphatase family protein [Tessaracoccus sp. OH4464_COT-324]RRD46593.1 endonuclease/exonuclease/phosphatase family protein [Tessaracoccus sp. OH4464_COT-324]
MRWLRVLGWVVLVGGALAAVPLWVTWLWPEAQLIADVVVFGSSLIPLLWAPTMIALAGVVVVGGHFPRLVAIGVASVLAGYWALPLFGPLERPQPVEGELQFVNVNARFGHATVSSIRAQVQPSTTVLVVQEFTPELRQRLAEAGFERDFPFLAGEARVGPSGTAVYSRVPVVELARVDDVFLNLLVRVELPGGAWHLGAIHTAAPQLGAELWHRDALAVAEMLRPHVGQRLVAVGDFNAVPEHITMRAFTDLGLSDPMRATISGPSALTRWQPTWPVGRALIAFARIDHVLVGPGVTAAEPAYFVVEGSDHKGIRGGAWSG